MFRDVGGCQDIGEARSLGIGGAQCAELEMPLTSSHPVATVWVQRHKSLDLLELGGRVSLSKIAHPFQVSLRVCYTVHQHTMMPLTCCHVCPKSPKCLAAVPAGQHPNRLLSSGLGCAVQVVRSLR